MFLGAFDNICVLYVPRTAIALVRACVRDGAFVKVMEVQGEDKAVVVVADHEAYWDEISAVCQIVVLPRKSLSRRLVAIACWSPVAVASLTLATAAAIGAVVFSCYLAYRPFCACLTSSPSRF